MSSATTTTGRYGKFYQSSGVLSPGTTLSAIIAATAPVLRATMWNVSQKPAAVNEWGDSDGGGWTNRSPGRRDVTFTAEGKFDTAGEQWERFQGGDYAAAVLMVSSGSTQWSWGFPRAVCMEFALAVNIDTEEVVGWTSSWGNDGAVELPGGALSDVASAS